MREHAATPRLNRVSASVVPPLILLVTGAAVEWLRPAVLLLLLLGLLASLIVARRRRLQPPGDEVLVYAACLAVALNLAWDGVPAGVFVRGAVVCADRLAPFAALRVVGAVVVIASLGLLLRAVRANPRDIGLQWPARQWVLISLAALPVIGVVAVLVGPLLAEPFFGPTSSMTAGLGTLLPALAFAVANASMEEIAYRGALLRWLAPATGMASALAMQAVVFGLAHGVGTDFIGSPLPVMAATAATGLVFGVMALRTRSLLLPIAIHIALDIPVFYGKVCLGT